MHDNERSSPAPPGRMEGWLFHVLDAVAVHLAEYGSGGRRQADGSEIMAGLSVAQPEHVVEGCWHAQNPCADYIFSVDGDYMHNKNNRLVKTSNREH